MAYSTITVVAVLALQILSALNHTHTHVLAHIKTLKIKIRPCSVAARNDRYCESEWNVKLQKYRPFFPMMIYVRLNEIQD